MLARQGGVGFGKAGPVWAGHFEAGMAKTTSRVVVNYSSGRYVRGQARLRSALDLRKCDFLSWAEDDLPPNSPTHKESPYGFKAFALSEAASRGYGTLLWADASIVPNGDIEPLWGRVEREGYWFSRNGYTNYEWTCESAYGPLGITPEENRRVEHVVATCFALDMRHQSARTFLDEYKRLATNGAFVGPWANRAHRDYARRNDDSRCYVCGPSDVRGHRHDQTGASVIVHRLGWELTNPPSFFAYRGGERADTYLVADGSY